MKRLTVSQYAEMSFEQLAEVESGTILHDSMEDDGIRFIIMRGPVGLCAYVGIPLDHPLTNIDYDNLPVECHGGLTFSGKGDSFPKGRYWYGWDYAHCGDLSFYDLKAGRRGDKAWTVAEVKADSWSALYSFGKLVKLAETVARRTVGASK